MVRDVRYITLSSTYRDVQEALLSGQLRTLALVESKGKTTCVQECLSAQRPPASDSFLLISLCFSSVPRHVQSQ